MWLKANGVFTNLAQFVEIRQEGKDIEGATASADIFTVYSGETEAEAEFALTAIGKALKDLNFYDLDAACELYRKTGYEDFKDIWF